jgi:TonB family protein
VQVVVGIVVGLSGAILVGRLMEQFLVRTAPTDPVALGVVSVLLIVVATTASIWPARRAAILSSRCVTTDRRRTEPCAADRGPTCKVPRREIALVIAVAVLVLLMTVQLRRGERMPPPAATMVFTAAPPAPPPPQGCYAAVGFPGRPPRKIVDVKPLYPEAARARHVTGTVIIAATIDGNGRVIRAEVRRSVEMLDTAALEAVKQWQFAPATLHGKAACVTIDVAVPFF